MITRKVAKKNIFDRGMDCIENNRQSLTIVSLIILIGGALLVGHSLWMDYYNKKAQNYFGAVLREYNQSLADESADWTLLRTKFEKGFNDYSRSSLIPYYKNYVVAILRKEKKIDEAGKLLDTIIADTQSSAINPLYATEKALMNMDSADDAQVQKGIEALRFLADDMTNQFRDSAQFYLGRYYWLNGQMSLARSVWQKLVDEQADQKIAPSPWLHQVKEYLKIMIV